MAGAPDALEIVLERAAFARELEDDVARGARVEHRLHHRLLQCRDAGARPAVAPLLERMVVGQDQVAGSGGLIHVRREADLVCHLAERLLERAGQRVRRVRAVDEQQGDLAVRHGGRERCQLGEGVGRTNGEVGAEFHQRPDRPDDVIQDVHRGDGCRAIRALRRHAAGNGEPAARPRKLAREADDRDLVDPNRLRHGARTMCCLAHDHLRHR